MVAAWAVVEAARIHRAAIVGLFMGILTELDLTVSGEGNAE
jgi:hypothetical protein